MEKRVLQEFVHKWVAFKQPFGLISWHSQGCCGLFGIRSEGQFFGSGIEGSEE